MSIKEYLDKFSTLEKVMGIVIIGIVFIVGIYIYYQQQQQTDMTLLRGSIERQNKLMEDTKQQARERKQQENLRWMTDYMEKKKQMDQLYEMEDRQKHEKER